MIVTSRKRFELLCARRQRPLERAMACVVERNGERWTVDETHPDFPHPRIPVATQAGLAPPPLERGADDVSFLSKARGFAVAAAKHFAAGMPTCSDAEILRRHDICMACEHFRGSSCTKCGCPVYRDRRFVSKLAWAEQSCPVGKWGPAAGRNSAGN